MNSSVATSRVLTGQNERQSPKEFCCRYTHAQNRLLRVLGYNFAFKRQEKSGQKYVAFKMDWISRIGPRIRDGRCC